MRHIPNDHIKTIIKVNFTVYRQINTRIKMLLQNPTPENKAIVQELRLVRCVIGKTIDTV